MTLQIEKVVIKVTESEAIEVPITTTVSGLFHNRSQSSISYWPSSAGRTVVLGRISIPKGVFPKGWTIKVEASSNVMTVWNDRNIRTLSNSTIRIHSQSQERPKTTVEVLIRSHQQLPQLPSMLRLTIKKGTSDISRTFQVEFVNDKEALTPISGNTLFQTQNRFPLRW